MEARLRHLSLFIGLLLIGPLSLAACSDHPLRGEGVPSVDGRTYLIVADNGGGECPSIKVDQKDWPHKIGEPGPVEPGKHTIDCGGPIAFRVPEGEIFTFNYWGP
jgi:hypothetical protein